MDGLAFKHHVAAISRHRSRLAAQAAGPLAGLALLTAGDRGGDGICDECALVGAGKLCHVSLKTAGVSTVLCFGQLALSGRGVGRDKGAP